jgi:PAS domain S-box-containing protein
MRRLGHLWELGTSRRGGLIALAVAGASTLLALGITSLTIDPTGTPLFIFFLGAVLVSTFLAGWRSGLSTIVFSAAAGLWYYFRPLQDLDVAGQGDLLRFFGFLLLSTAGMLLIHQMQRMQRRERLLKALVDTSPSLTVLTNSAGHILLFNRKCEELTGYPAQDALGKNLTELLVPEDWRAAANHRMQKLQSARVTEPQENPWKTRDGSVRLIEWRCVPIPSGLGEKPYLLSIGIDVSDARAARERTLNAERMAAQAEVINQLAHELNNPLQALTNVVELLRATDGGENGSSGYLVQAEDALARMNTVSHSLLTVTAPRKSQPQSISDTEADRATAD